MVEHWTHWGELTLLMSFVYQVGLKDDSLEHKYYIYEPLKIKVPP